MEPTTVPPFSYRSARIKGIEFDLAQLRAHPERNRKAIVALEQALLEYRADQ
jgi:hypothetical protein